MERLARLAYPEASEQMILTLTKEQFIDALPDEDTKLRIRQLRPKNLQQALETALEMESYHLAARQRRPVREVRLERRLGKQQQKYTGAESKVLEKLQECLEVFQSCRGEKGSTGRPGMQAEGALSVGVS